MISQVPHSQLSFQNFKTKVLEALGFQALSHLSMFKYEGNLSYSFTLLNAKIEMGKQMIENEAIPCKRSRGGNNIAQNIKKSALSLLKRKLPTNVYDQLQVRFIKGHNIRSQKQNLVLIFMFLEILHHQQKVSREQIVQLISQIKLKIEKYIANSTARMYQEEWRREFHLKNIAEFRKFQKIDLDFSHQRNYEELKIQIGSLYLRKKQEFNKAQTKVKKIIQSSTCLRKIFQIQDSAKEPNQSQLSPSIQKENTFDEADSSNNKTFPND